MESTLSKLTAGRKIVVFGASNIAQYFANTLPIKIEYFLDNDPEKVGKFILGKPIHPPIKILSENSQEVFVIIASSYGEEISKQLQSFGLQYMRDFIYGLDFISIKNHNYSAVELLKQYINHNPHVIMNANLKSLFLSIQELQLNNKVQTEKINKKLIRKGSLQIFDKFGLEQIDQRKIGFDLLIHGSHADETSTPFSDIDDIVILNESFFQSYEIFEYSIKVLHELNHIYQLHDITQHHGHWVFTYNELLQYDESMMPECVFDESLSVFDDAEVSLCPVADSRFQHRLLGLCNGIERYFKMLFANKINLYYLKHLVSAIALVFPLYFQSRGVHLSKREALAPSRIKGHFETEIIEILEWATVMRKFWSNVPTYSEVEKYKTLYGWVQNRKIMESAVAYTSPSIPSTMLNLESVLHFETKTKEFIRFFKEAGEK